MSAACKRIIDIHADDSPLTSVKLRVEAAA